MPARRRSFAAAALAVGLGVAFVAVEIGLRVYHAAKGTYAFNDEALQAQRSSPWIISGDPELVYEHRPAAEAVGVRKTDSRGLLHAADVPLEKPADVLRVALVGDSVGASLYLNEGERMAARLQTKLSARLGRRVQVLNFCVNGYDTLQEARVLESRVGAYSPDAVLLLFCLNDPAISATPQVWFKLPEPPASYAAQGAADAWHRLFPSYGRRPWAPAAGPAHPVYGGWWRNAYFAGGEGWTSVERGLDRVAAWTRRTSTPLLVGLVPLVLEGDDAGRSTEWMRNQVARALEERGLPMVSLQDATASTPATLLRTGPDDIYHFNSLGQGLLAEALAAPVAGMLRGK